MNRKGGGVGRWRQKMGSNYGTWKFARKTDTEKWQFGKNHIVYQSETDQDTMT